MFGQLGLNAAPARNAVNAATSNSDVIDIDGCQPAVCKRGLNRVMGGGVRFCPVGRRDDAAIGDVKVDERRTIILTQLLRIVGLINWQDLELVAVRIRRQFQCAPVLLQVSLPVWIVRLAFQLIFLLVLREHLQCIGDLPLAIRDAFQRESDPSNQRR